MDIQFIGKNKGTQTQNNIVPPPTPNIINGLIGIDLTVSVDNTTLLVKKSNIVIATIVIKKIVTWEVKSSIINIINADPTVLTLTFVSNTERNIALTVLENAMNL
jgi:hypothetical protein